MKRLIPVLALLLLASCKKDYQYSQYFEGGFVLDSMTNDYGPTVNIAHDSIIFNEDQMTTKWITDNTQYSQSEFHVISDLLIVGYQVYDIIAANENRIIYKQQKPFATGTNTFQYTYFLSK